MLSLTTSKVLGEISYSIYLMHGVVLFLSFNFLYQGYDFFGLFEYASLLPVFLFFVIAVSCVTYLKIERVFIKIGKNKMVRSKITREI